MAREDAMQAMLVQLLVEAQGSDCTCGPCVALRLAWNNIGLPEPKTMVPMCKACATTEEGERIERGAEIVAGVYDESRCMLCGFPRVAAAS